jgi:regulatory factor X
MIRQMLSFPSSVDSSFDNESLRLPDIGSYLPTNTDFKVAEALAALYRTHCISVIDSFRFCKERNLFRHFSAFHGTLTVPVQKLLTHPNIAPWIKECDWLMYQKMIEFIAPLTTQVVPRPVLDAFGSISQRLTSHISETFKAHPVHVSVARLAPAHIFCNLLKHMLDVNQSANAAAAWLCHPDNRNQMWLDFATFVDPNELISKANIPTCSEKAVERLLRNDIRALLTPLDISTSPTLRTFYQQSDDDLKESKSTVETSNGDEYSFPDKWISFILSLSTLFPNHPAQCIVGKVDKLWDVILHRLTLGGAQSFSAWWITKVFFHEMLLWQVEKGGFLKHTASSLQRSFSTSEPTITNRHIGRRDSCSVPPKSESFMTSENQSNDTRPKTSTTKASGHPPEANGSSKSDLREKSVTLSESMGNLHATHHDDSAIELCDDSILMSVGKYDMMASDPADAEGDVVVV